MPILRIGLQTLSFRIPLRRALEDAARLGADGVEIDLRHELPVADLSQTATRQLRKLLDDLSLSVAAAAFPLRRGLGESADLDRRVAALMSAISAAAKLGASNVVTAIGEVPESIDAPARTRMVEALTAIGAHGDRVGARLAAIAGAEPPERLAALLDELPEGIAGASLHPLRLLAGGRSPLDAIAALGHRIQHVSATDAVRDLGAADKRLVEVPLGRGSVDFPELLAALEEHDYRGWLTIERRDSADPEREIGDAVEFLRRVQLG